MVGKGAFVGLKSCQVGRAVFPMEKMPGHYGVMKENFTLLFNFHFAMGIYPVRFCLCCFVGPVLHCRSPLAFPDLPLRESFIHGRGKILLVYFAGWWMEQFQPTVGAVNQCQPLPGGGVWIHRKYFWEAKSPVKFAEDVQRLISILFYLWKLEKVAVVGYSFGADVVGFLPEQLQHSFVDKLLPITLMSFPFNGFFEVRFRFDRQHEGGSANIMCRKHC